MAWSVSDTASYCFIADRTDLVIRIQTYMKGRLVNPFIIGLETFFLNFQTFLDVLVMDSMVGGTF